MDSAKDNFPGSNLRVKVAGSRSNEVFVYHSPLYLDLHAFLYLSKKPRIPKALCCAKIHVDGCAPGLPARWKRAGFCWGYLCSKKRIQGSLPEAIAGGVRV